MSGEGRDLPDLLDLLDLLRWERSYGRPQPWRQVNLITHSHGGLVTRNFLHGARAESPRSR